jgi:PKHD-type hydroxylase
MNFEQPYNNAQNYYYFVDGFSKEELNKIYKDVATIPFQTATVAGAPESESDVRKSSIKWIPQDDEWKWLYEKLMNMAKEANSIWGFDLISAPEQIQYTEYYGDKLGHYGWHQDIGPNMLSLRKISITVQLSESDEYVGGDLEMFCGEGHIQTSPRGAGVVFIFPSYMMHRVTPVTSGVRRSFVLWLGGAHYR